MSGAAAADRTMGVPHCEVGPWRLRTAAFRVLPDFLILGAQKAGTTSLHRYLEEHPCVLRPATKEVHYFDLKYDRGLDWYRAHFPTTLARALACRVGRAPAAAGDASPYYLFHPLAPRRAFETVPNALLLVLLRDPVTRAHSHYRHAVRHSVEDCPTFAEAIALEDERLAGERERIVADGRYDSFHFRHHSYLARGCYADQLRAWFEYFPRERFLILKSEDLFGDPGSTFARVLAFLGLPPWEPREFAEFNRGDDEPLDPGLRAELRARFSAAERDLNELLGPGFEFEDAVVGRGGGP